jgi:hypothetical protein
MGSKYRQEATMEARRLWLAGMLWLAAPAGAQVPADSGAFVVRLGVDTVGMERYVRTGDRIEAVVVSRSPRTVARRVVYMVGPDGGVVRAGVAAEGQEPQQWVTGEEGAIPLLGGSWVAWELVLQRAHAAGGDSVTVPVVVGNAVRQVPVRRVGPDRFELSNQFDQPMTARVDARGRLVAVALAGGGNTVERVGGLDVARWAREFAERDARGVGLGPLSPRDSATATVRGATITVAYGRPALRGRPLEVLVPPGEIWRTGANEATTLTTDRPLQFPGLVLAAGSYSLFTLPGAGGWTLILNRRTGMSGLDRDPAEDVGRVPLQTRFDASHTERFTIEVRGEGEEGVLVLRWGKMEAAARFRVGN